MIYTPDEKQKLDNILAAFREYIQAHPDFDILYSEKVGYVRLSAEDPEEEGAVAIHSVDKLLDVLFNENINDVRFRDRDKQHYSAALDDEEREDARSRITKILTALGEEADYCLDFLDTYLEDYPDNDIV